MNSFAFIVHPVTIEQIKKICPAIRAIPGFVIKPSLKNIPIFKVSHIQRIQSVQKKEIQGYFVACPLTPKYIREPNQEFVLNKIISAAHFAERLGVNILGLSRYASLVTDNGTKLFGKLKVPLTTGSTFSAWSVFEAIYRTSKMKNIDLEKSHLAVIDADTAIGSLCLKKLSEYIPHVLITGQDKVKLKEIQKTLAQLHNVEVEIKEEAPQAVAEANIVVNTSCAAVSRFELGDLKANTLVCDISLLRPLAAKADSRQDITVIEGDLIKLRNPIDFGVDTGLPKDMIHASLAETMLLTLEEKFVDYSLGENINPDKLEEIANIAVQHGFEVWVPQALSL